MNGILRILSLLFCLVFASNFGLAQGWERAFNHFPIDGEVLRAVLPTADDGFLLLGVSGTDLPQGPRSHLQKVDADGKTQWLADLFPNDTLEAWKMARMATGRLAILAVKKTGLPNFVPTFYAFTCDDDGSDPSGPHALITVSEAQKAWDLVARLNGGSVVTGRYKISPQSARAYVQLLDNQGVATNSFPIPGSDSLVLNSVFPLENADGFLTCGYFRESGDDDPYLLKLSANGTKIWDFRLNDPQPASPDSIMFHEVAAAADGSIWVVGSVNLIAGVDSDTLFVQRFSAAGQPLWKKNLALHISNLEYEGHDRSKILTTNDGGLVILFETFENGPGDDGEDIRLMKIDAAGDILWNRQFGREARYTESPFDFCKTNSGGFAVAAWLNDTIFQSNDGYLLRTDSAGRIFSNYVEGRVFFDENLDCAWQTGEKGLVGWQIQALRQGELVQNALTGFDGKYALPTDTGQITLRILPPNAAWEACQPIQIVQFSQPFDSASVHFSMQAAADCPMLEADISTLLLRRCFESAYTVSWANRGTVVVPDAQLSVELDPFLNFISSDISPASQNGQTLFFDLGDLEIGDFGQIHLKVEVDCDSTMLGQAHCSTVKITPDSICLPSANWSGAHIEVDATCDGDSIHFSILNTGNGAISEPAEFVIIEDELLFHVGQVHDLPPGQDTTFAVAAWGKTYRLDASPEPNDPIFTNPSVAVEGCGLNVNGTYSMGYVTIFPNDDGDPTSDTDCRINQGSFDPNQKTGFPTGYGDDHFILPKTEIEYLIQFQNTGSDTAFTVVLRDTLDAWLDPATIRAGSASHFFELEMLGPNVLKFTFPKINLPDSTTNEPASHGFATFKIKPRTDIPLGTKIMNRAAIYFDFNEPVLTNRTSHLVDTGFIFLAPVRVDFGPVWQSPDLISIAPNPVFEVAKIGFNGGQNGEKWLQVFTSDGRLVRQELVVNSGFQFFRKGLAAGQYFLQLVENQEVIAIGKIVFR